MEAFFDRFLSQNEVKNRVFLIKNRSRRDLGRVLGGRWVGLVRWVVGVANGRERDCAGRFCCARWAVVVFCLVWSSGAVVDGVVVGGVGGWFGWASGLDCGGGEVLVEVGVEAVNEQWWPAGSKGMG